MFLLCFNHELEFSGALSIPKNPTSSHTSGAFGMWYQRYGQRHRQNQQHRPAATLHRKHCHGGRRPMEPGEPGESGDETLSHNGAGEPLKVDDVRLLGVHNI